MNNWPEDRHGFCASPSVMVIPPPTIYSTRGMSDGANLQVDTFCPPRLDFSRKPGWIPNAGD